MTKGHWKRYPGIAGHYLAVALDYRGIPFLTIVEVTKQRGQIKTSIPIQEIVCFWSRQCRVKG